MPSRFVKMAFEADNSFILFEFFKYSGNIKCINKNLTSRYVCEQTLVGTGKSRSKLYKTTNSNLCNVSCT